MVRSIENIRILLFDRGRIQFCNNFFFLKSRGLKSGIIHKKKKNQDISQYEKLRNKAISKIRSKIESIFGTMKRKFHFFRSAYFGKCRTHGQFISKCICSNLLKAVHSIDSNHFRIFLFSLSILKNFKPLGYSEVSDFFFRIQNLE